MEIISLENAHSMLCDMGSSTSNDDICITSAFRSHSDQSGLSVAAGYSDHHSGMLISIKAKSGTLAEENTTWLNKNAHKYGFVVRYPADKTEITNVSDYTNAYRYVGVAHAKYMVENNLCLEEYVASVQQHPWETPLSFIAADGSAYIVYYATAYTAGVGGTNLTQIKTPKDYTVESVSGDNIGGFIITVKLN